MSRRRYLSTNISLDAKVNRLALTCGDFAVLLYTWLIPHATDDGCLPSDPEELLYLVLPGRRDKTTADIVAAIDAMRQIGLLQRSEGQLRFPPEAFFRYQTYVTEARRTRVAPDPLAPKSAHPPTFIEGSAQNSADPRDALEPAQNATSSSFSSSLKFSSSLGGTPPRARDPAPEISGSDEESLAVAFAAVGLGAPTFLGEEAEAATVLLTRFPPADIAACWQDVQHAAYGSAVDRTNLSFAYLSGHNRVANWQTWRDQGKRTSESRNGTSRQQRDRSLHPPAATSPADSRRGTGVGIQLPDDAERARLDALTFRAGPAE